MILISTQEIKHLKATLDSCQEELRDESFTDTYAMLYEALEIMDGLMIEADDQLIDDYEDM